MDDAPNQPLPLPGGVGLTRLRVYDSPTPDGLIGGSAHVHQLCTEGYYVLAGRGAVQTLGPDGPGEVALEPGVFVWFSPGTIHRLVNHDRRLEILVVMQNNGLPEAGDAVLTLPPQLLADPQAYAEVASLSDDGHVYADGVQAARRRRDLSVEGFRALWQRVDDEGPQALADFYTAAARLLAPKVDALRAQWEDTVLPLAEETRRRLDEVAQGRSAHLADARAQTLPAPTGEDKLGMCGTLGVYPPQQAAVVQPAARGAA